MRKGNLILKWPSKAFFRRNAITITAVLTVLLLIGGATVFTNIFAPSLGPTRIGDFDQEVTIKASYGQNDPDPLNSSTLKTLPNNNNNLDVPEYRNYRNVTSLQKQTGFNNVVVARLQGELQFLVR